MKKRSGALLETLTQRFRAYREYRDSGVEWLGEIPSHWGVDRLKTTVRSCQNGVWGEEPDGLNDIVCVRVADFDRVRLRVHFSEPTLRSVDKRIVEGRLLSTGDLLLEKSGGGENQPVGAVVLYDRPEPAICSNFIARMAVASGFDSRYLAYLHHAIYSARLNTRSIKQSTGIQNLDSASYLDELAPLPPLSEQRIIAEFLDRETSNIDKLLAQKENLIELLQKKRDSLISQVVTRGVDPSALKRDSGVNWLGEIPAHWELRKLKALAAIQPGLTLGKKYESSELVVRPYLRVANVQAGYLDLGQVTEVELPIGEAKKCELLPGDVLVTEGGDFDKLGRGYVWEGQVPGCLHQNHIFAVRVRSDLLDPYFLAAVLGCQYGRSYFTATSVQSTNLASTNRKKLGSFIVPLPSLREQHEIMLSISSERDRVSTVLAKIREAMGALAEYRTSLVSAAISGKVDVRKEVS